MVAVIGDIHGCYYTLAELYSSIVNQYPSAEIFAVGDLVDRGNFSYEVIEFLRGNNIRFTPGNHDYMFSYFFRHPQSLFARSWNLNGNEATLFSYQGKEDKIQEHIEVILNAPLFYNLDDCFISHAGISSYYKSKSVSSYLNDQYELQKLVDEDYLLDRGVLWTRDVLLDIGKLQVVGHTKHDSVTYEKNSKTCYVDTGACIGNKLSSVIIDNNKIIDTISEPTHLNDIV